jgi:hypothetical protein
LKKWRRRKRIPLFPSNGDIAEVVAEALGEFGFFDSANQLGITDRMSAGIGFHGSKRKLGLVSKPSRKAGVAEDLADGESEFL